MSPDTPGFGYDSVSPAPSPVLDVFNGLTFDSPIIGSNTKSGHGELAMMSAEDSGMYRQTYTSYGSSYSTLEGWAGDMSSGPRALGNISVMPFIKEPTVVGSDGYNWPHESYADAYRFPSDIPQYTGGVGAFSDGTIRVA